jgi:hypothetical protein
MKRRLLIASVVIAAAYAMPGLCAAGSGRRVDNRS